VDGSLQSLVCRRCVGSRAWSAQGVWMVAYRAWSVEGACLYKSLVFTRCVGGRVWAVEPGLHMVCGWQPTEPGL